MDIFEHKKKYQEIISKYNLSEEKKAEEIAQFLTKNKKISAEVFSQKFGMTEKEAVVFLSFIEKGIEFKTKHIDNKES